MDVGVRRYAVGKNTVVYRYTGPSLANVASLSHYVRSNPIMSHIPCHDQQRTLNPVSLNLATPPTTTDKKRTLQL